MKVKKSSLYKALGIVFVFIIVIGSIIGFMTLNKPHQEEQITKEPIEIPNVTSESNVSMPLPAFAEEMPGLSGTVLNWGLVIIAGLMIWNIIKLFMESNDGI